MASVIWTMKIITDVIPVPIEHGHLQAARRYVPMVRTHLVGQISAMHELTRSQIIRMLETKPFSNVQITVETGAATIIGMHLMSVATAPTPMISSHYQREYLWHR